MLKTLFSVPPRNGKRAGFTLWECCVSLCLMAMMLGSIQWQTHHGKGVSLKREVDQLHAKLHETRLLAAMQRVSARLLIHVDDREEALAWKACVVQLQDESDPQLWHTMGEVHTFQEGHRVLPMKSDLQGGAAQESSLGLSRIAYQDEGGPWPLGTWCYSLEFKPTGRITHPSYLVVIQREEPGSGKLTYRGLRVNSYGQIVQLGGVEDHETSP